MAYLHKRLRAKKSMALSNRKQVEKLNKIKNTSTEEEILYGLQTKDHSLQPSTLDIICKKCQNPVPEIICNKNSDANQLLNTGCLKDILHKRCNDIELMIGERMDILNNDFFNKKLENLNRRVEQVQCKKTHEEIAKTFLKKVSKLERRINAVIAFKEEAFSKMPVHQTFNQFPHLPPLSRIPLCPELAEEFKDPPQNPELKVAYVQNPKGIALSTLTEIDTNCASLHSHHLYLFHENLSNNSVSHWKKIGKIRALPLSMACCLSQVIIPKKYYFVIQKDICGCRPFCGIQSITP
ncbi:LOW QUALITY PROTEIN: activating transcription factor 7-interacting protein 2 [Spheniscus humboldti]